MQITRIDELKTDLARNGYRPVYTITGPEMFLVRQAFALLRNDAIPEGLEGMNYSEFSVPEDSAAEFLAAANTFPMMSPRRMVAVQNVEKLAEDEREPLYGYIRAPSVRTVLVLLGADFDRRTVLYRTLRETTCMVEFTQLRQDDLKRWAAEQVRSRGYSISSASLEQVVDLAGSDLESVANEVEKLLLYAGNARTIPDSAVVDLVQASRQHGIFELTDAIGVRDKALALKLLANLLEGGEEPIGITAMLARHFRMLLVGREAVDGGRSERDAADVAQVPNYGSVRDAFRRHLRLIDAATAAAMYRQLASLDLRLKSSGGDPRMLLEMLICSL